ncbi:hypothetical protein ACWEN6_36480 [Sphaerisporangium sp. NPDC004334]
MAQISTSLQTKGPSFSAREIACGVQAGGDQDDDALLLQKLPRTPRIVAMSAHATLHMFAGWRSRVAVLTDEQTEQLWPALPQEKEVSLSVRDHAMVRVLALDGRAGYGEFYGSPDRDPRTQRSG